MTNVINIFSLGEDIDIEQYRGKFTKESFEHLKELFTCRQGDILRAVLWDGQFVGAIRLSYNLERRVGFIRCLIIRPQTSPFQDVRVFRDAVNESVSQFIRLCFKSYRQLHKIYWNVNPYDELMCEICHRLLFKEMDPALALVSNGLRYRSFILERLS